MCGTTGRGVTESRGDAATVAGELQNFIPFPQV